jgi:RNA polymerase sigma-70 factor (ECF subfamily)
MSSLDLRREQEHEDVGRLVNLLESGDLGPSDSVVRAEASQLVRETLDQLPESMHALIQLVYYQGMKYREAAEILDIPVGTVKSRLHAAIARLTDVWKTSQVD